MAGDLLERVVDYFGQHSVPLPDAQYVAPGNSTTIAFDDGPDGSLREAIAITVDFLAPGQPGADRTGQPQAVYAAIWYAQLSVLIVRRAAVMNDAGIAPKPSVIQDDAATNSRDLSTLTRALEHIRAGCLSPGGWAPAGSPVAVMRAQTVGPMGAAMAVVGSIQAAVDL
jgi:hypothetical protein